MKYSVASVMLLLNVNLMCQILYDFDDDIGSSFQMEGDGVIDHQSFGGNPDGCMRIEEVPNGFESNIILPYETIGDWAIVSSSDFISFDYFLHSNSGNEFIISDFVIEIVGPNIKASALPEYIPPALDSWHSIYVSLNESEWNLTGGSWENLLAEVEYVRIRNEFIVGDEYILIDNINLSFAPTQFSWTTQCSNFDLVDGWSFLDVDDYEIDPLGQPSNSVKIYDQGIVYSMALAPPKYHGDWDDLEDVGTIEFDLYVETTDLDIIANKDFIFLGNEEHLAKINLSDVDYTETIGGWQHFSFPIEEFAWEMVMGTWEEILNDVREIRIDMEFVFGNEVVYFDNFCVSDNPVGINEIDYGTLHAFPNPCKDYLLFSSELPLNNMLVTDALGQIVKIGKVENNSMNTRELAPGVYYLLFEVDSKNHHARFIKE